MYTIVKKEILNPTVVRMVIDAPAVAKKAQPGQFIILRVDEEVEHAIEEGIVFKTLCNPVEILGYNNPDDRRDPKNFSVCGIKCVEMELGEPDASGRRRPVVKENSEFLIDADCVIMALGRRRIRLSNPQQTDLRPRAGAELLPMTQVLPPARVYMPAAMP